MSVLPLRLFGDPVLTTPADEVTSFDAELRKLVRSLDENASGHLVIDRTDAPRRKAAMRAIRAAEWCGGGTPRMKVSPHRMTDGYR